MVSSVVRGFEAYREAARAGIEAAGCEPVLVNEDHPATDRSSRLTCLDAVDSSDAVVLIVAERGGWLAPSGKPVVEEEFDEARSRKIPVLLFIKNGDHDALALQLIEKASNYVTGLFRVDFNTELELKQAVTKALAPLVKTWKGPVSDPNEMIETLNGRGVLSGQAAIRLVLQPERVEEVFDPVSLGETTRETVYEVGHRKDIGLFSFEAPKKHSADVRVLTVIQGTREGRTPDGVYLSLSSTGLIRIDSDVTGRSGRNEFWESTYVDTDVAARELAKQLIFVGALYDAVDRFERHQRFYFNSALVDLGYKVLQSGSPARGQGQRMNMFGSDRPVVAFDKARILSRSDLRAPVSEARRAITMLSKRIDKN
jgi:hypothetical protein